MFFTTEQFLIWLVFALPVVAQGFFAYVDNFLIPGQVKLYWGKGLPFVCHGGMWSDVVLFAPLMAYLIGTHGGQWGNGTLFYYGLVFGTAASCAMHFSAYAPGGRILPEAHTHDGILTAAGWVHLAYMAIGIAVLALFYLDTLAVSAAEVWSVSGLLFVHVIVGTHVPFKAWVRWAEPTWYPPVPVLDMPTAGTIAGTTLTLVVLSFWALR